MNVIKGFLSSKKFWALVAGIMATVASALQGAMTWPEAAKLIIQLVMVYIGAVGITDFGKAKR